MLAAIIVVSIRVVLIISNITHQGTDFSLPLFPLPILTEHYAEHSIQRRGRDRDREICALKRHTQGAEEAQRRGHCQVSPGKAMDLRLPSPPVLGSSSVISGDSELAL